MIGPEAYTFEDGTPGQFETSVNAMKDAYLVAYDSYKKMLDAGVAREVARVVDEVVRRLGALGRDEVGGADGARLPGVLVALAAIVFAFSFFHQLP